MATQADAIAGRGAMTAEKAEASRPVGSRPGWLTEAALYLALTALALLFTLPFLWLVMASLKPPADIFAPGWIPRDWTTENYEHLFQNADVARWLWNSTQIAILGVVSVVFSSSLVAYGFARLRFRGRNKLFALVIATYMVPTAVTMVPTFLVWNELGLVGTFFPLWAGNLFGSAFYIFMLRQFLMSIPQDLMDAARVDGAGYLRIYWNIMLPLIKPALAAVAIFEFQAKWNDFMAPLIYLNRTSQYTMSLGLGTFKTEYETQWPLIMAASVIFTLPMVILFFLAQRYFLESMTHTGLKG
jgi:multiple sugar transport system permease protein